MKYIGELDLFRKIPIVEQRAVSIFTGSNKFKSLDLCLQGVAVEEAIRQNMNLEYAPNGIYEYDLFGKGKKFEIKSKKYTVEPQWWSFNNYDYFLTVKDKVDYIIFCPIIDNKIYIKYIANAKTFDQYIQKSMFDKADKQYYYNNKKAIKNKHCKEF